MNTHLLQIKTSPRNYQKVTPEGIVAFGLPDPDTYWSFIPTYLIAICPYCRDPYNVQVDTYSLLRWSGADSPGVSIFDYHHQGYVCQHFILALYFINLNGLIPARTERSIFKNHSEVPFVIPRLLKSTTWQPGPQYEMESLNPIAVIHALPICRIEDDQFVPRYSLFTLTYYAEYPDPMRVRYYREAPYHGFQMPMRDDPEHDLWWDLDYWVQQKKLHWLDANNPHLQKHSYPDSFPYHNIEGIKHDMTYRDGKTIKR